ncbi:heat-inducible transcriptional repressor HrcA [Candidatus Omnitrophota bacterium]
MVTRDFAVRRDKILGLIINSYISTAVPIASRTISRKLRLNLSSATIRNIMSDLEEMGMIMHPHTSAGRIPTQKGYRYYINKLMQAELLNEEEKRRINKEYKNRINELDNVLDKTSDLLSSLTHQTGIVLFPLLQKSYFKKVQLIKVDEYRILMVLLSESGFTNDILIDTDGDIDQAELLRIANFINSHINKGSLLAIRRELMQRLIVERDSFFYVLERAKAIIDVMLDIVKENKVYLNGRAHIAAHPEFHDADKLQGLFNRLEDKDFLFSLLKKDMDEEGVHIYIGSEVDDELSDCSLITCNYCVGDTSCGTLGIIGPTRMEYGKMVAMVEYVASSLSRTLSSERSRI